MDALNMSTQILCIELLIIPEVKVFQVSAEFSRVRKVTTALDIPLFPIVCAPAAQRRRVAQKKGGGK